MSKNKSVWLVYHISGSWDDYHCEVTSVYSSFTSAVKAKRLSERKKNKLSLEYMFLYGSSIDKDRQLIDEFPENINSQDYNVICTRYYYYINQNPLLKVHTIKIEEKEILH